MAGLWKRVIKLSKLIIGQPTAADIWKRVLDLSAPIIGQPTVDSLQKNLSVSENISRLHAALPRAWLLIERSESWGLIYKPIDDLFPQLKEAVEKAQSVLDEFDSQRQTLEGAIRGELVNNLRNWICGFPDNVESAKGMLDHVCNEMEKICSMLDIPQTPNKFNEHISRLSATLPRARLLIERSECWRFRYKPIDELLPQLKEAVYKAEFELDDIKSKKRILEGASLRIQSDVVNYIRNWISDFPGKVKNARNMLDHICNEMEKLCTNYKIQEKPNQFSNTARPITSSGHPEIFGRDKELDVAIRLLGILESGSSDTKRVKKENLSRLYIGDSSSSMGKKERLKILPIVGMGGVGKTTVAQMIYNDERVHSYFDLKIWICVSEKFDLERLTKQLIECATRKECNLTNLNNINETLEEIIKSKRVLLVLDDVWSNDWQQLLGTMSDASEGTAIILTTRYPEQVKCTWSNKTILNSIRLEGLEENIYWDFFKSCAGLEVGSENYIQLVDIAREICNRLKGSPLAAKTLGGLLRKRIDKQHWVNIRDSKMWKLKQEEENDIMPVLRLSYQYLPSHLKKCFLFCSLYPKDYEFTDIELAKFWIMEGFIPLQDNLKHMEDLALGYFHELKHSCFFHLKVSSQKLEKYVIHDLMHDVCQSITTDECYCFENENSEKIYSNIYHLSVFLKKLDPENLRKIGKFKKLHSLIASSNCGVRAIKSWCDDLRSIRCLSLSKCKINKIPENIGNLKHLQYLDISGTDIQNLPDSFCILYNLQHLDMRGCDKFSEYSGFPDGSNKLTALRFFRPPLHLVQFLTHIPNILSAMQLYNLSYNVNNSKTTIENIKYLTGVHGFLDIRELGNISRKEAAEGAELNKQEHLDTLRLYWQDDAHYVFTPFPESNKIHMEVLEGLRPHSNLAVLEISNYYGQSLPPSWMGDDLPNLRRVKFQYCLNYTISQLPRFITELVIVGCHRVTSLEDCLQPNLLPKLKCLELYGCKGLVLLPIEQFSEFTSLEKLKIGHCENLECPRKMVLPPSIKSLYLRSCPGFENSILSCLLNLNSLEEMEFYLCQNTVSIPDEVMRNLKSLRRLSVQYCANLESLGDREFLESIKDLTIEGCHKLKKMQGRNLDGLKLSGALRAAPASSSHTIIPEAKTSLLETPTNDIPSSSNGRKRKHMLLATTGSQEHRAESLLSREH